MEVIIKQSYEEMSQEAAEIIRSALIRKPNLVLGLASGETPIGLYDALIRMHKADGLDFSQVVTFNLDEYVGLPTSHPQSYSFFMEQRLFSKLNIPASNRHLPPNTAENHEALCEQYEQQIRDAEGIDIQVLGIGRDGHIAFNEPSSSLGSRTRIKSLQPSTIATNARHFGGVLDAVPKMAITMGVGTIMEARRCILLAGGDAKADAVARCVEGPITAEAPASALQMHPRVTILIDEAAASKLKRPDYYKWAYENKLSLERDSRSGE